MMVVYTKAAAETALRNSHVVDVGWKWSKRFSDELDMGHEENMSQEWSQGCDLSPRKMVFPSIEMGVAARSTSEGAISGVLFLTYSAETTKWRR